MNIFESIMKYTRGLLAFVIIVGAFVFLFMLLYVPVPVQNAGVLNTAVGFVLGMVVTVAAYYFGTSKDKSDSEQAKIFPKEPPNP